MAKAFISKHIDKDYLLESKCIIKGTIGLNLHEIKDFIDVVKKTVKVRGLSTVVDRDMLYLKPLSTYIVLSDKGQILWIKQTTNITSEEWRKQLDEGKSRLGHIWGAFKGVLY